VTSTALLLGEVAAQLASAELVEDPLQYADFSAWQHELSDSEEDEARAARAFWEELGDARSPVLPFTRMSRSTDADGSTTTDEEIAVEIDDALARALADQADHYGATPAALVQAAWHAVLGRFQRRGNPTVLAYLVGERRHPDLRGRRGALARPSRSRRASAPTRTFAEVLAKVARARGDALVRQELRSARGPGAMEVGFAEYPARLAQPAGASLRIERWPCAGRSSTACHVRDRRAQHHAQPRVRPLPATGRRPSAALRMGS